MIALLGRTVLHTAIVLAVLGAALGWAGGGRTEWARRWAARMALAFALAMLATNLLLEVGLLQRDFSLSYVAQVGSRQVPDWVAAASLWSALDGSLLFFGLLLSGFAAVFALRHRGAGLPPSRGTSTALAVLLSVGAGFALLSAVAASPFGDVLPPAPDGPGPNPLLQNHVLMAIHPPVLYLGYVGLAVPFALAAAALREGRLDRAQLASLRSWLLVAWVFLTAGIALGARWAYDVLGWGGYWSWDPVENASLMPWLVATSALHSLRRLESRGGSPIWPLAQVQAAFALALLGTFLTRSGIVDSVHSFAPGPVGPALLLLLGAFLVVSVVLLASSARTFDAAAPERRVLARGSALIANNLVLALLTFAVLLGTLFPIVARVWEGSRVTVGESYYDGFAVPLGVALLFLMGVGPALPWGGAVRSGQALRSLVPKLLAGTATAGIGVALGARSFGLIAALSAGGFALAVAISGALGPLVAALREPNRARVIARLVHGRRLLGAHLAHAGIAIALVAIAASNAGKQTREATLRPGEWVAIGDYQVTFRGVAREHEPHRESLVARFDLLHEGRFLGHLAPRLSRYPSGENLGSPAVLSSPREDLYLTLLGLEPGRREIGLRLQISPLVSWLWIGIATSLLGALIALPFPSRKRARARTPAKAKAKAAVPLASHAEARA